jgi:hypothetical protein
MQYSQRIFCSDDLSDSLPEDEFDKLFSNLEKVEPPSAVIDRILSSVSKLPRPLPPDTVLPMSPLPDAPLIAPETTETTETEAAGADQQVQSIPWVMLDGLVVRKEQCEPS